MIDSTTDNALGTTTITNNGHVGTYWAGAPASYVYAAIIERGPGRIELYNYGTLHGRVDFFDANSSYVLNTSDTSWHTTGDSILSDGPGGETIGYYYAGGDDFFNGLLVNDFVVNDENGLLAPAAGCNDDDRLCRRQ